MPRAWLLGGAALLGVLLIGSVAVALLDEAEPLPEGTPEAAVQRYLKAAETEDYQLAYSLLSSTLQEALHPGAVLRRQPRPRRPDRRQQDHSRGHRHAGRHGLCDGPHNERPRRRPVRDPGVVVRTEVHTGQGGRRVASNPGPVALLPLRYVPSPRPSLPISRLRSPPQSLRRPRIRGRDGRRDRCVRSDTRSRQVPSWDTLA